ncbi:phosphatase PAP2 family protein [Pseudorhodoferax sp.]|uniref:phosphatase PAP2 family protein n=1 Tax=Pseudorhodoferax sp. TaxID=1993553 RepID=UPI0039E631FD
MPIDFWRAVTHLGNSSMLLPAALVLALWLAGARQRQLALAWSLSFGAAVLLVLASKLAFLGWGVRSAWLDFTGISGHSMVSTAVFTFGAWLWAADRGRRARLLAIAVGLCVGALVGVSRVVLHAHSVSEVVAGFVLGAAAACLPMSWRRLPSAPLGLPWLVPSLCAVLVLAPQLGRPAEVHHWVVQMALAASGRAEVFQRGALHR